MTTFDFSPLFRSTIGFDRFANLVEDALRSDPAAPSFPPYNIERRDEDSYRITLAVPGFAEDDLTIETRENTLIVSGRRGKAEEETTFLHRGIAEGDFQRTFRLADHVKATGATFERGLLYIDLVRELPESMKPRRIAINGGGGGKKAIAGTRQAA